jgi:alcohol dehydrogenase class IV
LYFLYNAKSTKPVYNLFKQRCLVNFFTKCLFIFIFEEFDYMNFDYQLPVNLIFGRGRIRELGIQTAKFGKKALLVTGGSSAKKSGLLDKAIAYLNEAGIETVLFDGVPQNPLTSDVYKGVDIFLKNGCDIAVGIGGGSVLDTTKAIAFAALNKGDISDYIFGKKPSLGAYPIILSPTTAGTGSEGNCFAVLTNPETNDKKSLKTPFTFAKASIIDPELMITMPKKVIASTAFDALAHCHEAYLSKTAQPLNEMMALHAIKLLSENICRVYNDPSDVEAWESVAFSSTIGGMVINIAGVGLPHAMEHPASGLKDIVHGVGLAALTPAVMEFNMPYAQEKYEKMAQALGGNTAADAVSIIRKLLEDIGLNVRLGELGIKTDDIEWMSQNSLKIMKANVDNNPRPVSLEDICKLYEQCL